MKKAMRAVKPTDMGIWMLKLLAPLGSLLLALVEELAGAEPEAVEETANVDVTTGAVERIEAVAVPSSTWM